jgi:serine phosphatase RsbU (regulator of sigma subunit)
MVWFLYYFPFAWQYSTIRGQLPAMHAVLLFHMSGTLIQHFAVRFLQLTENQGLWMQTIRLITLLLVTFAMAILLNRRAASLANEKQRLSREIAAAAEVQTLMLPGSEQGGAETTIEAVYQPASEVGGDFYQILDRLDGSRVALVGDVSGKGLKAAMLVSVAIGALRREKSSSPAVILAGLNEALVGQGGFVTCSCIRYLPGGELTVASAGHPAPYCEGREVEVEAGLPLGVVAEAEWKETRIILQPGAQVTLVSDGVVEAENAKRELFGFDRTRAISIQSAQVIADAARTWGQNDDITVVTVRRIS